MSTIFITQAHKGGNVPDPIDLASLSHRTAFIEWLKSKGIFTVFHYVPLHSSPRGQTIGRSVGDMTNTNIAGERLVRLPLWLGLDERQTEVIEKVIEAIGEMAQ